MLSSCNSHFKVEKTTHNKVVVNESSNAEFIKVYVKDVEEDVEFQSIVYKRMKMGVHLEEMEDGITKITAVNQKGGPLVIGKDEPEMVNEPNQLIYLKDGKEQFVQLDEIEFLPATFK